MLRVVIDTNTIISNLWGGRPKEVVELWRDGRIKLVVSEPILKEYLRVLNRFNLTESELKEWTLLLSDPQRADVVRPLFQLNVIKDDPADDKFLECALQGKADFIVSGDTHLINLEEYKGIKVVNARRFLEIAKEEL
ncbi:MAG: putative toxin-antitoxin system toxin component, PIN family [bacterium]